MKGIDEYLHVYLIVQAVGITYLIAGFKNTRVARWLLSILFLYAGVYNMYIGLVTPDTYLDFARLSLPFYSRFINGWFSQYNHIIIPLIAAGQLLIGIGMLLKDEWVKWACIGTILFLISIIPLMVGSGFPFSITVSLTAYLVLIDDDHNYAWLKKSNYRRSRKQHPKKVILT